MFIFNKLIGINVFLLIKTGIRYLHTNTYFGVLNCYFKNKMAFNLQWFMKLLLTKSYYLIIIR